MNLLVFFLKYNEISPLKRILQNMVVIWSKNFPIPPAVKKITLSALRYPIHWLSDCQVSTFSCRATTSCSSRWLVSFTAALSPSKCGFSISFKVASHFLPELWREPRWKAVHTQHTSQHSWASFSWWPTWWSKENSSMHTSPLGGWQRQNCGSAR